MERPTKIPSKTPTRPISATENIRPRPDKRPSTAIGTVKTPIAIEDPLQETAADKTAIIRLHRENREKSEQIQELNFKLEKADSKLGNLRREYDGLVEEIEQTRQRLVHSEEIIRSLRGEALRYNEVSHKSVEVVEKELNIIREENRVLKAANEKLVANSLQHETLSQNSIKELQELQGHVQVRMNLLNIFTNNSFEMLEKQFLFKGRRGKIAGRMIRPSPPLSITEKS